MPLFFDRLLAWCAEAVMAIPMVSLAQLRILSDGIVTPWPARSEVPQDLRRQKFFTEEQIRKGLPPTGAFGLRDLRWFA